MIKKVLASVLALTLCAGALIVPSVPQMIKPVHTYAITDAQKMFIENLGSAAQKNYSKYKILPSMTVAQAILESSWGSSSLSKLYYNFFGMKAGSSYSGETVTLKTGEEVNGIKITVDGTFRVYHSFDEGIEGYYQFITGYSRYSNLIGETNYKTACTKIKEDGWATDSAYASKLINLIETYNLTRFDTGYTPDPTPSGDCFPACGSGYTSIVEALNSIGVDSSMTYRKQIAAANGISGYSGTAGQNTDMLNMLKSGTLKRPGSNSDTVPEPPPIIDYDSVTYFPACSSSYASIIDALKSIGVDSSMTNRKRIAEKNGISGYSGTAEQNTQLLSLLKSGKLLNPDVASTPTDTTGKYYPACLSSYTSIVDALKSIGVDSSLSYRKSIAEKNGISGYSGTANQNTQMLNLLKNGQLIRPDYVEPPVIVNYTVTLNANNGFSPVSSITVASNGSYVGLPIATREGYTFNGWYTSPDGGSQVSDGNALVSASNHTLYAHWTANTYTVTLHSNDGNNQTIEKQISYGSSFGNLNTLSRTGYSFNGWFTDISGGTKVTSNTIFTTADNVSLYAQWSVNSYKVSFDLNGGSGTVEQLSIAYENYYGTLPVPERVGYAFDGWYTSKSGGSVVNSDSEMLIASDHVLYAHWTILPVEKEELKLSETQITMVNGEQYVVEANQENLTYKSSNSDVAVVSKSGIITAVGVGTATISVINSDFDVAQLKVTVSPVYIEGDCNNDGKFTISDAVTLQKWLLAVPDTDLENWKAADLCEDGVINVFDLCVMKKKLINKK